MGAWNSVPRQKIQFFKKWSSDRGGTKWWAGKKAVIVFPDRKFTWSKNP